MRVVFVAHPQWEHAGSTILRSKQMAEFCKANIPEHSFHYQTHLDVKDSVVILHKFWLSAITPDQLKTLRDSNTVLADPIDGQCPIQVDHRLSVHTQQPGLYLTHLVDTRIPREQVKRESFSICYYGTLSNTDAPDGVEKISCYKEPVSILQRYAAHYTVRRTVKEGFKPPLKLWTAAVCGVPVLTSLDNDVPLYLQNYPYVASNSIEAEKVLQKMRSDFGTDRWSEAVRMVRRTYSDDKVVQDMRSILNAIA